MRTLALSFIFLFATQARMSGQSDGICCDYDSGNYVGFVFCQDANPQQDDLVCDSDCSDFTSFDGCQSIPLDGGLSLLALAGGGLATAAMRRRRREEGQRVEQASN